MVRDEAQYLVVSKGKSGRGAGGGEEDSLGPGPRELPMALSALPPTHGATTGEQVDNVVVERCHVVGNEDPDAVIPEPGVLLPGHEPQHCTHGPHHEPGDAGSSDRTASGRAEPGPDPPRAPGSEPAKDAVWQRTAD